MAFYRLLQKIFFEGGGIYYLASILILQYFILKNVNNKQFGSGIDDKILIYQYFIMGLVFNVHTDVSKAVVFFKSISYMVLNCITVIKIEYIIADWNPSEV